MTCRKGVMNSLKVLSADSEYKAIKLKTIKIDYVETINPTGL